MSQVRIIIAAALSAIASGAASAGFVVTLTDASGATQSQDLPVETFPSPAADGTFTVEADFGGVGSGAFSGTVQSIDPNRQPLGSAVSFSGTASNLQPVPVSVTVAFS
jgi:hypothetical protein